MNIREIVMRTMAERGWSAYKVGQESGVPIRTVQRYVQGVNDLHGEHLGAILDALELDIRPGRRGRKGQ